MSKYYVRPDGLHETIKTINGKRVAFRGHTDAEVEKKMLEYRGEAKRGMSFQKVAEAWEAKIRKEIEPSTWNGYKASVERAKKQFSGRGVKSITAPEINSYIKSFANTYAKNSVLEQLQVIRQILDHAILLRQIEYNPASAVKIPRGLKREHREPPTPEQIEGIKSSVDLEFGLFPFLILYTGCRRGEALALRYEDIDRKNKTITIRQSLGNDNNRPYLKTTKTDAGLRTVPLMSALEKQLPQNGKGYIFCDANGEVLHSSYVTRHYKRWQEQSGIDVTPHQIRHGYASILFDAGIEPKVAQELLGHAQISTTMDIYTHIMEKKRENVRTILEGYDTKTTQNTEENA